MPDFGSHDALIRDSVKDYLGEEEPGKARLYLVCGHLECDAILFDVVVDFSRRKIGKAHGSTWREIWRAKVGKTERSDGYDVLAHEVLDEYMTEKNMRSSVAYTSPAALLLWL